MEIEAQVCKNCKCSLDDKENVVRQGFSFFCSESCRMRFLCRRCVICNQIFSGKSPSSKEKHCSECKGRGSKKLDDGRHWFDVYGCQKTRVPYGFYVYGWYYPEEDLPFYIGRGTEDRAWKKHYSGGEDDCVAYCEKFRTPDTKIVIYAEDLSFQESISVEWILLDLFRFHLKAPLKNQT